VRVAYLVNQYPRTSHTFIRREILAVESQGVEVLRFSLRPLDGELVDPADRAENERTRVVLDEGLAGLALAVLATAVRRPLALLGALRLALRLGWRSERGVLRHVAYLAEACVLVRWLRRAGIRHVHAHFATNSTLVALLCRELGGVSFSFTVHGAAEMEKAEALRIAEKIRRASFVVAISGFGRAQLWRNARPEDWQKIHVVHCGVGDDLLRVARMPVPSAPRFVCVARLLQGKGHLVLVDAAARLRREGHALEIELAGDGPFRGAIERHIRDLGVEDVFHLTGWRSAEQVRDAILRSRALVHPSFAEGLPVVVMEALALGRPAVATAVAGTPELVQTGVTGWLVPTGSVEALADAMREALTAPRERLEEMGRAGAELVRRQHDSAEEARKLVALLAAAAPAS
jgi:colanic acid/amylovoran biosynthesis glycosyltransferase